MQSDIARIIGAYSAQGVHRTGTETDIESAHWLASEVRRAGLEPLLTSFVFDRFDPIDGHVEVAGQRIQGIPFYDCEPGQDHIKGRLVRYGEPGDVAVIEAMSLAESNPVVEMRGTEDYEALVVVTPEGMPEAGIALANAEKFGAPYGKPALQVARQHLPRLTAAIESGEAIAFRYAFEHIPATGINVGARLNGRDASQAPMVVMTPRSGWWQCASERGGGLVAWLEIMRTLTSEGSDRDVIFTANTGHELGHLGYHHFIENRLDLEVNARAWIHLGANFAAPPPAPIRLQMSHPALQAMVRECADESGLTDYMEVIGRRPGGEARSIYDAGGRYVSMVGGNPLFHHPDDIWPEAVDTEKTERACRLMVAVSRALARG
ncbi:MAG: M28 family peptidase [Pseudomonadota bacterium]